MFTFFLAIIEYNALYSMLKLRITNCTCLISLPFLFGIISCDAPPKPATPSFPPQTLSSPKKDTPIIRFVERPIRNDEWKQEAKRLRERLVESYAIYWPLISSEHQHNQLPEVLGDPMEELRTFGVERVGVFLRDGVATEEELQLVVDRLNDVSPRVRRAVAKLLAEIQVPGIREHVAKSLDLETDSEVIRLELLYFQTNPHEDAVAPTIKRMLQNPNGSAGNTLIALLNAIDINDEAIIAILQATNRARKVSDSPALLTLEAMLGDTQTRAALVYLLDNSNELTRIAVAKGFASAGFSEPLLLRANDPSMYMYALNALQNSGSIDSFKHLLELYVEDEPAWNAAAISIAASLNTAALLRADDMLKRTEELDTLRLSILSAFWKNASGKSLAAKKAIVIRTVPLMVEHNDYGGALQLLDADEELRKDEDIITLTFETAINALAWETAVDARSDSGVWIATWEEMKKKNPADADVMKIQILQRFENQLSQEQLLLLGVVPETSTLEESTQ